MFLCCKIILQFWNNDMCMYVFKHEQEPFHRHAFLYAKEKGQSTRVFIKRANEQKDGNFYCLSSVHSERTNVERITARITAWVCFVLASWECIHPFIRVLSS